MSTNLYRKSITWSSLRTSSQHMLLVTWAPCVHSSGGTGCGEQNCLSLKSLAMREYVECQVDFPYSNLGKATLVLQTEFLNRPHFHSTYITTLWIPTSNYLPIKVLNRHSNLSLSVTVVEVVTLDPASFHVVTLRAWLLVQAVGDNGMNSLIFCDWVELYLCTYVYYRRKRRVWRNETWGCGGEVIYGSIGFVSRVLASFLVDDEDVDIWQCLTHLKAVG